MSAGISEAMKSISNTKQVEVETIEEGSSVLGLPGIITDDRIGVCRGNSNEVETTVTQRESDWDNEVKPIEKTELLRNNFQLQMQV